MFYVKRFLIENPDKEENILTAHAKSYLEKIFTDYRPQAEIVFAKKRGKDRQENLTLNLEEFISVKGITAMGNQLTKDKVLEINGLEPLPYVAPEEPVVEEIEVVDEEKVEAAEAAEKPAKKASENKESKKKSTPEQKTSKKGKKDDDDAQTTLF